MNIQICTMPQFFTTLNLVHKRLICEICHKTRKYLLQNAVTENAQKKY